MSRFDVPLRASPKERVVVSTKAVGWKQLMPGAVRGEETERREERSEKLLKNFFFRNLLFLAISS